MNIKGKFSKVAETDNSIIVGTLGILTEDKITFDIIKQIAEFYGINANPDKFQWHLITAEGAKRKGYKFPINNYNEFIEFFTA